MNRLVLTKVELLHKEQIYTAKSHNMMTHILMS